MDLPEPIVNKQKKQFDFLQETITREIPHM